MTTTAAVKNLIREGKTFQLPSIIETGSNLGMQTLGQALQELVIKGKITPENAVAKGLDPSLLNSLRLGAPTMVSNESAASAPAPQPMPTFASAPTKNDDDDDLGDLKPLSTPFSFRR